jgi:hypothetical protein
MAGSSPAITALESQSFGRWCCVTKAMFNAIAPSGDGCHLTG